MTYYVNPHGHQTLWSGVPPPAPPQVLIANNIDTTHNDNTTDTKQISVGVDIDDDDDDDDDCMCYDCDDNNVDDDVKFISHTIPLSCHCLRCTSQLSQWLRVQSLWMSKRVFVNITQKQFNDICEMRCTTCNRSSRHISCAQILEGYPFVGHTVATIAPQPMVGYSLGWVVPVCSWCFPLIDALTSPQQVQDLKKNPWGLTSTKELVTLTQNISTYNKTIDLKAAADKLLIASNKLRLECRAKKRRDQRTPSSTSVTTPTPSTIATSTIATSSSGSSLTLTLLSSSTSASKSTSTLPPTTTHTTTFTRT